MTEFEMSLEDEVEWFKVEHKQRPAPYALCPECNRFSKYPWMDVFYTQNGADYVTAGVCSTHGPFREGSL